MKSVEPILVTIVTNLIKLRPTYRGHDETKLQNIVWKALSWMIVFNSTIYWQTKNKNYTKNWMSLLQIKQLVPVLHKHHDCAEAKYVNAKFLWNIYLLRKTMLTVNTQDQEIPCLSIICQDRLIRNCISSQTSICK